MLRLRLISFVMLFACTAAQLAAEPFSFSNKVILLKSGALSVQTTFTYNAGLFYGTATADLEERRKKMGQARMRFGMRPKMGNTTYNLSFSRSTSGRCCGTFSADMKRPLGTIGLVDARLWLDTASSTTRAMTKARIPLSRSLRFDAQLRGGYNNRNDASSIAVEFGFAKKLSRRNRLNAKIIKRSSRPARAEMLWNIRF